MPVFEDLFLKSKGKPIEYNGQIILMVDRVPIKSNQSMSLFFESVGSKWKQGISLSSDGSFIVNGQEIKKAIVLWQDTAPVEIHFTIKSKKGELFIKNVWDTGDGVIHSWHNGAAMIVEKVGKRRKYRCNDGQPNDDFTDLIFSLEIEE